jgi:H+/Cl- antiporter ClcA
MNYIVLPIEVSIGGIYFPPLLLAAMLGALVALITTRYLDRFDWTVYVWHPPLFLLALVVIFTVLIGMFIIPF